MLHKIDPVNLNATLSALAEGLRGNGDDLGATLSGLNYYLQQLNPKLPTLQDDLQKAASSPTSTATPAPIWPRIFDNAPAISNTIVDQQDNLNATLLAATGLANNGTATLEPAENDYIAAIQRLRVPLKVAADYSPEFGCIFQGDREGDRYLRPCHRRHPAGPVRRVQLPARLAGATRIRKACLS